MVDPALVVPAPSAEDPDVVGCSVRSPRKVSKPGVWPSVAREDLAAYLASRGLVASGEGAPDMLVEEDFSAMFRRVERLYWGSGDRFGGGWRRRVDPGLDHGRRLQYQHTDLKERNE